MLKHCSPLPHLKMLKYDRHIKPSAEDFHHWPWLDVISDQGGCQNRRHPGQPGEDLVRVLPWFRRSYLLWWPWHAGQHIAEYCDTPATVAGGHVPACDSIQLTSDSRSRSNQPQRAVAETRVHRNSAGTAHQPHVGGCPWPQASSAGTHGEIWSHLWTSSTKISELNYAKSHAHCQWDPSMDLTYMGKPSAVLQLTSRVSDQLSRSFYVPSRLHGSSSVQLPGYQPSKHDVIFYMDFNGFLPGTASSLTACGGSWHRWASLSNSHTEPSQVPLVSSVLSPAKYQNISVVKRWHDMVPQLLEAGFHVCFLEGLFHRVLMRAIRWSQDCGGHEPQLSHRKARFFLDPEHDFVLEMAPLQLARIKVGIFLYSCHLLASIFVAVTGD